MKRNDRKNSRRIKVIRWIARIWGSLILAIVLFITLGYSYNLITEGEADPYAEEDIPPIEYSGPVLMLVSTIGLAIAWKFEGVGGLITVGAQVLFIILQFIQEPISLEAIFIVPLILSLFVMLPGLLFVMYWKETKKKGPDKEE
jgi:hypothetical protein